MTPVTPHRRRGYSRRLHRIRELARRRERPAWRSVDAAVVTALDAVEKDAVA